MVHLEIEISISLMTLYEISNDWLEGPETRICIFYVKPTNKLTGNSMCILKVLNQIITSEEAPNH